MNPSINPPNANPNFDPLRMHPSENVFNLYDQPQSNRSSQSAGPPVLPKATQATQNASSTDVNASSTSSPIGLGLSLEKALEMKPQDRGGRQQSAVVPEQPAQTQGNLIVTPLGTAIEGEVSFSFQAYGHITKKGLSASAVQATARMFRRPSAHPTDMLDIRLTSGGSIPREELTNWISRHNRENPDVIINIAALAHVNCAGFLLACANRDDPLKVPYHILSLHHLQRPPTLEHARNDRFACISLQIIGKEWEIRTTSENETIALYDAIIRQYRFGRGFDEVSIQSYAGMEAQQWARGIYERRDSPLSPGTPGGSTSSPLADSTNRGGGISTGGDGAGDQSQEVLLPVATRKKSIAVMLNNYVGTLRGRRPNKDE